MMMGRGIMRPNDTNQLSADGTPGDLECPLCGGDSIVTFLHSDTFKYGSGDSAATLHVNLPVRRCNPCKFEFVDHEGERLRHEAVCRHIGVLSPTEVRDLRARYGMTRAAFAQATALGEATLSRWENGALIQNRAHDRYLRLLRTPWIMNALRLLATPEPEAPRRSADKGNRFRCLVVSDSVRGDQASFRLRPSF